jgi:hypothetical protein
VVWIVVTLIALAYAFVWALCRAAALGDDHPDPIASVEKLPPGLHVSRSMKVVRFEDDAPFLTYSDEPRVKVERRPKVYDWEEREDFDG